VELWRPEVTSMEILWAIFAFFSEKRSLTVKFSKSFRKVFTASPIDIVVFKCRKICPTGNRWNRALFTWPIEFRLPLKLLLLRGLRPKSAKATGPAPNNMLTVLKISSKSVHFRRSYSRTREHRFLPRIEYLHDLP